MGGDYTRFTFDPRFDYAGVLSQQGRVQLDADWNELFDILDRRFRAETVDLIGRSGVPANAPLGFELDWQGANDLRIGRGRMYVDGLIAENHGSDATEYEPIWDEPRGGDAYVLWSQQPYEPQWSLRPKFPPGVGPHLVYLDVWRRERTAAEFSGLVDPAVGVDTDTRLQTVWQVRFIAKAGGGVKCSTDWNTIARYRDATRLSGARLTTQGLGVTQPDDPCFVSPTGGYRGRENRLYRVEIHDDGSISGQRSFKWSRDNGSVAANVLSITDPAGTKPRIQASRIGRDAILRFHVNDWVEVLDDALEFDGVPGILAQVDSTEEATNVVWLKNVQQAGPGSSPAALTDISTARNARLRRWDGTDAGGVVVIPGVNVELEDGVFVRFDFAAGAPRVGDWWSFAARSITGEVELLDTAPPRGVRHHYAPLGILRGPGVKPDDCRTFFPVAPSDCCDCDVCVNPKSHKSGTLTIQAAIDKVKANGGKVCLQVGIYELRQPLRIQGAHSVQLVGKGIKTILVYDGPGPAIDIESSQEVTIERLAVVTSAAGIGEFVGSGGTARPKQAGPELGILVTRSQAVTIQRCLILQGAPFYSPGASEGMNLARSPVLGGVGIGLAGMLVGVSIRHNLIFAETGVASMAIGAPMPLTKEGASAAAGRRVWETGSKSDEQLLKQTGRQQWVKRLPRYLVTLSLVIEQNTLACWRSGVDLVRFAGAVFTTAILMQEGETRVAQNTILGCGELGVLIGGMTTPSVIASGSTASWFGSASSVVGFDAVYLGQVFSGSSRVDILSNVLAVQGVGIAAGSNATRIAGNEVAVLGRRDAATGFQNGIMTFPSVFVRSIGELQVDGNRVHDAPRYGIALEARVDSALIKRNQVTRAGLGGIAVGRGGSVLALVVEDNQILDTALEIDERDSLPTGIEIARCGDVTVARNEIVRVGAKSFSALLRGGIHAIACQSIRIAENDVRDVGPASDFSGAAVGIHVEGPYQRVDVNENSVLTPAGGGVLSTGASIGILIGRGLDHPKFDQVFKVGDEVFVEEGPEAKPTYDAGRNVVKMGMISTSTSASAAQASPVLVRETAGSTVQIVGPDAVRSVEDDETADVAVRGNLAQGAGTSAALIVRTLGDCLASDNRCALSSVDGVTATVWIQATRVAIVSSNRAEGTSRDSMFILVPQVKPPPATVLGNITSDEIRLNFGVLGNPWAPLNARG